MIQIDEVIEAQGDWPIKYKNAIDVKQVNISFQNQSLTTSGRLKPRVNTFQNFLKKL
jgi:hypothetical protein